MSPDDAQVREDREAHDAGASSLPDVEVDGGTRENEPPRYETLARAAISDAGAEFRIEEIDGGFGLRLSASSEESLSVEPIGRLMGPSSAGIYFGPSCPRVEPGGTRFLGRWTGEISSCATVAQPMAVFSGEEIRVGCREESVEPGEYEITLWPCGAYDEPFPSLTFSISTNASETEESAPSGERSESKISMSQPEGLDPAPEKLPMSRSRSRPVAPLKTRASALSKNPSAGQRRVLKQGAPAPRMPARRSPEGGLSGRSSTQDGGPRELPGTKTNNSGPSLSPSSPQSGASREVLSPDAGVRRDPSPSNGGTPQ